MVRQGSLVIGALVALALVLPGLAADKDKSDGLKTTKKTGDAKTAPQKGDTSKTATAKSKAPAIPIDRRPYTVRMWVSIDPEARMDAKSRDVLLNGWKALVKRFVGNPWTVDVADGEGPFEVQDIHGLSLDVIKPLVKDRDKGWFIRISPADSSLTFSGREFDTTTGRLGPLCSRTASAFGDAARAFFLLTSDIFEPVAEVGASSAGGVSITVQGASLEAADAVGKVVAPGRVFRPMRIMFKQDGSVDKVVPVKVTYLRVERLDGGSARCQIVTSVSDPLTKNVRGKNRMIALGVKPSAVPTRLRYVFTKESKTPAAGYTLTARNIPTGPPREVGLTDREGRIVLQPGFANGLVMFRLLAGGVEPLTEFPFMPGEQEGELTMVLASGKPMTVALETKLNALRDEVIDQVALRGRIEARLKAKADASAWQEVKGQLEEFRKLPNRTSFEERLKAATTEAEEEQQKKRIPVLTVHAQQQISELQGLMDRYLDDAVFTAYDDALKQALDESGGAKKKAQGKAASPKVAAKGATPPPAAAPSAPAAPPQQAPGNVASTPPRGGQPKGSTSQAPQPPSKAATKPPVGGTPF
jgi:hypothetical protein